MASEPQVEVRSVEALEAWLEAGPQGVHWLVVFKRHHPDYVSWPEVVECLLCHGWIDSRTKRLDEDRSLLRVSPRRPGSIWSRVNKEAIERLECEGRMRPAGRAVVERAKADGSWTELDDIEALLVPDDLAAALDALPVARATWDAYPASVKKQVLWAVKSAKRDETRSRRIAGVVEAAAAGRRPG
jgi:uncharacterized protein YdeI (YjbR/CyaY-like superfamily)